MTRPDPKYTPGEWEAYAWVPRFSGDVEWRIGVLGDSDSIPPLAVAFDEEDARLLAEAPNLLRVCQETLTRLNWFVEDPADRSVFAAIACLQCQLEKLDRPLKSSEV